MSSYRRLTRSLSFRFAGVLFLVLAAGQGVGAVSYLWYTRSSGLAALHERMARTLLQVAGVSTQPVWNLDYGFLEPYLDEVMKDRDIHAVRVMDAAGAAVSERVRGDDRAPFLVERTITAHGEAIGRVELGYGQGSVDASLFRSLLLIPPYQAIMLALLSLAAAILVRVYVRAPVLRIASALERISAGDLTAPLPEGRDDEIAAIARGVNFLRERLHDTVAQARGISASVSQVTGQLDGLFRDVSRAAGVQQSATEEVSAALVASTELQGEVLERTEELLSLSGANVAALTSVRNASTEIAGSTAELTGSIDDTHATLAHLTESSRRVAAMAGDVARAVEEASASVQQVFAAVQEVEDRVRESADLSAQVASSVSEKGLASAARARAQVERIEAFMGVLGAAVGRLGARSGDVGGVLRVVTEVAHRIRLLSLNAQILAAQAGEHGKVFGVVAGEMESLSKKSAESSREIGSTLDEIQGEIREVVARAAEAAQSLVAVNQAVAT
ncbi:MAG: methyl-accepting chemotaxis protein, partial [Deferrisomatales bacterium]